jgi:hypothetical protein
VYRHSCWMSPARVRPLISLSPYIDLVCIHFSLSCAFPTFYLVCFVCRLFVSLRAPSVTLCERFFFLLLQVLFLGLILILYYCGRSWAGGLQKKKKKRRASSNSHIDVFNIKKYGEEEKEEIEIKLHTI